MLKNSINIFIVDGFYCTGIVLHIMIIVKNKWHLNKLAHFNEHIYIKTTGQVYKLENEEWVEKVYFTSDDLCRMLSIERYQLYIILDNINVTYKKSSNKSGYKFKLKHIQKIFSYHLNNKKAAWKNQNGFTERNNTTIE